MRRAGARTRPGRCHRSGPKRAVAAAIPTRTTGSRGPGSLAALAACVLISGIAPTVGPPALTAQEDFRAADPDRPILVEDAVPIKFREWEVEIGSRGVLGEGEKGLLGIFELKAGLFRNGQVGIEAEAGVEDEGPGTASRGGIESFGAHVFYHLRRDAGGGPALAVRADVSTPGAGGLGREDFGAGIKAIATRSFDRLRLHGNAGYAVASGADGDDYWLAGVGFDYPIGLFSRAVLGDVYMEIPVDEGPTRVWAELGVRLQTSNWSVLDVGLATRLDRWERGEANVELVVGLSRVFGIPGLIRVPRYPDPAIH